MNGAQAIPCSKVHVKAGLSVKTGTGVSDSLTTVVGMQHTLNLVPTLEWNPDRIGAIPLGAGK